MRRVLVFSLVAFLAANGAVMLFAPGRWYERVIAMSAAVPEHFVRDVGCAYLVSAVGLLAFALRPEKGRPAAAIGVAFLLQHALVHVWDAAAGRDSLEHLLRDAPGVIAVPLVALWLIWPLERQTT